MGDPDYQALAGFRLELRRFFAFSQRAAEAAGLRPQQYQALLAIKAHTGSQPMTTTELADELFIRLPTAVELIDRLEKESLVRRAPSTVDRRRMTVVLAPRAEEVLKRLASVHHEELRSHGPALVALLSRIGVLSKE
jgi:DNA-binding MarR family transcriptional regulator